MIELAPDDDYAEPVEPVNLAAPRRYGNHAMPSGSLVLPRMASPRESANDNRERYASLGNRT